MSWSVSALVNDGDTSALEENLAVNDANYNDEMREQQEFALNVVREAFENNVVEGAYSVSLHGHSNSEQENDRKSLGISLSPTAIPDEVV